MPAEDQGVYVISVAAELAGVHPQTLRAYERKGLLTPARTEGGTRRYSVADIDRLERITELTNDGLNLEGVRRVLELEEQLRRLRRKLGGAGEKADQEAPSLRRPRGDLVPLSQALVPWQPSPRWSPTPARSPRQPQEVR